MFKIYWIGGNTRSMWKIDKGESKWWGTRWKTLTRPFFHDDEWQPEIGEEDLVFASSEDAMDYLTEAYDISLDIRQFIVTPNIRI